MAQILKVNHPFDVNPELLVVLRRPENLDPEVKFYALVAMFLSAQQQATSLQSSISAMISGRDRSQPFLDVVTAGVYLSRLAGLKAPRGQNLFFTHVNDLDLDKVAWGARLFKVVADDEVTKQTWVVDRAIFTQAAKTDANFSYTDTLRVRFGKNELPDDSEDRAEVLDTLWASAEAHARLAEVDVKVLTAVREKMWEVYWSRNVAAPSIVDTHKRFWDEIAPQFKDEREKANAKNKEMLDELNKTNLEAVVNRIFTSAGVTSLSL